MFGLLEFKRNFGVYLGLINCFFFGHDDDDGNSKRDDNRNRNLVGKIDDKFQNQEKDYE